MPEPASFDWQRSFVTSIGDPPVPALSNTGSIPYHLVIKHSRGKSTKNGGFQWRIIYKWAIFPGYVKSPEGINDSINEGFLAGIINEQLGDSLSGHML